MHTWFRTARWGGGGGGCGGGGLLLVDFSVPYFESCIRFCGKLNTFLTIWQTLFCFVHFLYKLQVTQFESLGSV